MSFNPILVSALELFLYSINCIILYCMFDYIAKYMQCQFSINRWFQHIENYNSFYMYSTIKKIILQSQHNIILWNLYHEKIFRFLHFDIKRFPIYFHILKKYLTVLYKTPIITNNPALTSILTPISVIFHTPTTHWY